jgi:predicted  nucleic acid-binding Zn-ribbon protein
MSDNVTIAKTKEFIKKAVKVHGDKYNYDSVVYTKCDSHVKILCNKHDYDYELTPKSHLKGNGCPKCGKESNKLSAEKRRKTTKQFVTEALEIHGVDKYNYDNTIYIGYTSTVIIYCNKHKESFSLTADSHLRGHGCPKCGKESFKKNRTKTTTQFIDQAKIIHGNDKYNYDDTIYINDRSAVTIYCNIHKEFFTQIANGHLQGAGCFKCGCDTNSRKKSKTTEDFIIRSKEIHGDKYDYKLCSYIASDIKVIIWCNNHNSTFEQTPNSHLDGKGCSRCAREYVGKCNAISHDEFIKRAIDLHGDLFDYTDTKYIGYNKNITIKCNKGHYFERIASNHLKTDRDSTCPKCKMCPSCQIYFTKGELCNYCKPLKNNKMYQKTKEMTTVKFLKDNLPDNDFIHNKSVGKDCTNGHLFPDILFDCGTYQLIVEVDEHEHRGSDYSCDQQRMHDIIAKTGLPTIFIRYNPDNKISDKNTLLLMVKKYLNIKDSDKQVWDDYGFKAMYLYYKKLDDNLRLEGIMDTISVYEDNFSSYNKSVIHLDPKLTLFSKF